MKLMLRYEQAVERHPDHVAEVMAKLRRGKSKHRLAEACTLHWDYSYCIRCGPGLSPAFETIEDEVSDRVSRTMVHIEGQIGRWWGSSESRVDVPAEIVAEYRMYIEEAWEERARVAAMSPEERDRLLQDALMQASKSPGFAALYVGPPRG